MRSAAGWYPRPMDVLDRGIRSVCGVIVLGLLAVGCASTDGAQGRAGATGPAGPKGVAGDIGPAGAKGVAGDIGPAGAKGDTGDIGPAGPAGASGLTDGSACRDALGVAGTVLTGFDSIGSFATYCVTSPVGTVATLAGTARLSGSVDGTGAAARFKNPRGVAVDGVGNVYVADTDNHVIRKVTPGGVVTTLAGTAGSSGSVDGTGAAARFNYLRGVAVDGDGNVYVADTDNHVIRKVTPGGVVTTLAGTAGSSGSVDGTGAAARFNYLRGVAVDGVGNVYVADSQNNLIRKVTPGGVVTTLAGTAGSYGSENGTGADARLGNVYGVAVDGDGNVYAGDEYNGTVRKVTPGGVVTRLAGSGGEMSWGFQDAIGPLARFSGPTGVAVDGDGNVYVADSYNNLIRKVTPAG